MRNSILRQTYSILKWLELPTLTMLVCCAIISVAHALGISAQQLGSSTFRNQLSQTSSQFGTALNSMQYGRDGVCTAFAYRAQQSFEAMGVPSRIVWADTTAGYHAFNEVYTSDRGWQIYEPQRANGQPFFRVNNVQHIWDRAADAPRPGQGSSYAGNGFGGQLNNVAPGLMEILAFIMMFQQLKNMANQAKKNSELQREQKNRYEDAAGNLAAATL